MPWPALPFSDVNAKEKLLKAFNVTGIPALVVLDKEGKTLTSGGVDIIRKYGVEGYPFSAEKLDRLRAKEEAVRDAQTVESLLVSDERDFVISHGEKVPISKLVGKTIGLYFSANWCGPCHNFTPLLVDIYNEIKSRGEDFEIVFLSADLEEEAFEEHYGNMPWLALPFGDKTEKKLSQYYRVQDIPTLIILGPNGKTVQTDTASLVQRYGTRVYPFTAERLKEIEGEEEARRQDQTLESLLVSDTRDFVIKNGGEKVQVSDLVGKTIALYFSANWCSPCQAFTPKLIQVYNELKERGESFEIVFISKDEDQEAFEDHFSIMPWLALPFRDKVEKDLSRHFHTEGIPTLIVIGPDGKTMTDDAISAVSVFGAEAYPFTTLQIEKLQKEIEDLAGKSAKEIDCSQHKHPLVLTRKHEFNCDGCDEEGSQWSYYCGKCDFDLHLTCALKDQQQLGSNSKQQNEYGTANDNCKPGGVICDGDYCYRG
ncbi:probable nucleoredoxin 1-2 isoform X2 [Cryptomeria japonica]|nr:probable nucleoredoxin 1-2 isoform X2 [Cryptomeria japonica]